MNRRLPGMSCSEGEGIEYRGPWLVGGGSEGAWLIGGVLGLRGVAGISISMARDVSCRAGDGSEVGGGQLAVLILRKAAEQVCRI
jgi:hypothetical protein